MIESETGAAKQQCCGTQYPVFPGLIVEENKNYEKKKTGNDVYGHKKRLDNKPNPTLSDLAGISFTDTVQIYSYGGIVMAFKDYVPKKGIIGSEWVGNGNFSYMFSLPNTYQVLWNTL